MQGAARTPTVRTMAAGDWSALEERVGTLYRALGYDVTRDVLNRGSQIDLVAERRDPVVGRIRICVEVKHHPGSSMPIQEVRDFLRNASNAVGRNDFDKAHLVTSGKVTRNARAELEGEAHLRVLTVEELERELLQPDASLQHWLDVYRREPISKRFVDVTATLHVPSTLTSVGHSVPSTELLDVAMAEPGVGVVVLADYGSGKSTLLKRLKAMAIERRSADPSSVVPVLIELRDLTADFDVERVALAACRTELGIELPPGSFWSLLGHGRFLILLDGFDEITLHASAATREHMLAGISPLLFGPSPAILTSRPSYFASFEEYRDLLAKMRGASAQKPGAAPDEQRISRHADQLADRYATRGPKTAVDPNAHTFQLDPLTGAQIDQFLEQAGDELAAAGTGPREVREFLDSVYDLSDLISRPIILDMAVESTLEGVIDPSQRTLQDGPSGLYEAYARVRLKRDWLTVESRQELLSHDIRMRFAEECARYMHDEGVLRVDPGAIAGVAARTLALGTVDDLDAALTDLRTCSFLTIDDSGALEFIHRSYQEFFLARLIRADIERNETASIGQDLRWEYAYFLGAFGYTNSDTYQRFRELARGRPSNALVADNAAQAQLIAREVARDLDWHGRDVAELRRPRTQIIDSTLHDVGLRGLLVEQVDLTECDINVTLEADGFGGEGIGELSITNCNGKLRLFGRIDQTAMEGGDLEVRVLRPVGPMAFESMHLRLRSDGGGGFSFRNVTGRAQIGDSSVAIENSDLWVACNETVEGAIADSLVDTDLAGWQSLGASLNNSAVVVHGVRASATVSTATRRSRRILDEAPAGSGSVVVADPSVIVDRWWARQVDLVSIGAQLPDGRHQMTGLFVLEQPRPSKADHGPGVLEFWTADATISMEGWGDEFDQACHRLSKAVEKASARSVANGTWLTRHLIPLLDQLGCPQSASERLNEFVAANVGAAGPVPRS